MRSYIFKIYSIIKKGFLYFEAAFSFVMNYVLLSIVYLFGAGLVFIYRKYFMRSGLLDLDMGDGHETYWEELHLNKKPEDYYRQF